jgi:hypothetical protein
MPQGRHDPAAFRHIQPTGALQVVPDWISAGASAVAIAISLFALWQSSRHRRSDLLLAASSAVADTASRLGVIAAEIPKAQQAWHAYFNVASSLQSGARIQMDAELSEDSNDVEKLNEALEKLARSLPELNAGEIAKRLPDILRVKAATDRLSERIDARSAKLDRLLDSYRADFRQKNL